MIVGVTNLKGGVGKTTLSINIAVCLAHTGYKTVIIDTDLNQNSFVWYSARDITPDIMVVGATDPKGLLKVVKTLSEQYDAVIIDGTPTLSEMNTSVMMASDMLLIPTRPGAHDIRAMREFIHRIEQVKQLRPGLKTHFIVNEYDERILMHQHLRDSLFEFDIPVLKSNLKTRTAYGESNFSGMGAYEHEDLKARTEITQLAKEIIELAQKYNLLH